MDLRVKMTAYQFGTDKVFDSWIGDISVEDNVALLWMLMGFLGNKNINKIKIIKISDGSKRYEIISEEKSK